MRHLFALVLIAAMPLAGMAQIAPAPQFPLSAAGQEARPPDLIPYQNSPLADAVDLRAVPLWGTADGRILTMAAASGKSASALTMDPTLPKAPMIGAPAEWRLVDVTDVVSGSLLLRMGEDMRVHVSLSHGDLLLPNGFAGNGSAMGMGGTPCATPACMTPLLRSSEARGGLTWFATDDLALGFSYGLSWLRGDHAPLGGGTIDPLLAAGAPLALPGLSLVAAGLSPSIDAQSASFNALGQLRLDGNQVLDLGANVGRIQLAMPGVAPLISLNQAALSFGIGYGRFAGTLTGHTLGADSLGGSAPNSPRWTGLDVGLSWRTPWSGLLRIGTQNLWSSGSNLSSPSEAPIVRELDANQARVPYVQYRQDL